MFCPFYTSLFYFYLSDIYILTVLASFFTLYSPLYTRMQMKVEVLKMKVVRGFSSNLKSHVEIDVGGSTKRTKQVKSTVTPKFQEVLRMRIDQAFWPT